MLIYKPFTVVLLHKSQILQIQLLPKQIYISCLIDVYAVVQGYCFDIKYMSEILRKLICKNKCRDINIIPNL